MASSDHKRLLVFELTLIFLKTNENLQKISQFRKILYMALLGPQQLIFDKE